MKEKIYKILDQLSLCVGNEWTEAERYHAVQNALAKIKKLLG